MQHEPYLHIERLGTPATEGILDGRCYIFPKLDGTRGSAWLDAKQREVLTASSNRILRPELGDNQGFRAFVMRDHRLQTYFNMHPKHVLFGEWLVRHTLKSYREDAWKKFYVFDVFDWETKRYKPFTEYVEGLQMADLDFIPPFGFSDCADTAYLQAFLATNTYLLKDGEGVGEGIVIKNYQYWNKYGTFTYAKLVRNEFKDMHRPKNNPGRLAVKVEHTERMLLGICEQYVSQHLVDKTQAKIINDVGEWTSKLIPRLLQTVYHDVITEEMWTILKQFKSPTIDFKRLYARVCQRIKLLKPELF